MNPLQTAIELAKEAGQIQMESHGKAHQEEYKGTNDLVTDIDKKCEALIVDRLQKEFRGDDILAEEGTGQRRDAKRRWIIDPIDGTTNYHHGHPMFGPSIALEKNGEMVFGVVYLPFMDELFVAEKGAGAELNGKKINVSVETELIRSLLATGFAYNVMDGEKRNNLEYFSRFLTESQATRRGGMAEGDLCYVACGRYDGFWELFLKPWDVAAGTVIIREAGGMVTRFSGDPVDIYADEIVASNGQIHEQFLAVLNR